MSNVLILVEHADGKPKGPSLRAITFGRQVAAKSGGALHLLVLGKDVTAAAEAVRGFGAAKVHTCTSPALEPLLAEGLTPAIVAAARAADATMVAAASSSTAKDALPRVAVRLDAAIASDVMGVVDADTFVRPMWAGNVTATVKLAAKVKVCTVRATEFEAPEAQGSGSPLAPLEVALDAGSFKTRFVSHKEVKSARPDVTTAERVVSGGRGVKGADGFKVVEQLADALGAGVGASRAVCDAGWVPNDLQIGQTGKIVAPKLYVALGISGAIQHLAGMKGSKTIVAVNKDPEAPIFQVADYGLVSDLFAAVPELIGALK